MSLKCGIIGLPNVGKSTCLNALSQANIAVAENYPFCTIDPNHYFVPVPDKRLEALACLIKPKKVTATTVQFVDIAGLVKGAAKNIGRGNKFLSNIEEVDVLIHVVRCFNDVEITHVHSIVDPKEDVEVIETELKLSDLAQIEKLQQKYQRLAKSGDKETIIPLRLLDMASRYLEENSLLNAVTWKEEEVKQLKEWKLLSIKPMIYLANVSEDGLVQNPLVEILKKKTVQQNASVIVSCIKLEAALIGMKENEKEELFQLLNYQPSLNRLIQTAYRMLNLQTFFTAGLQEVRAWTIPCGATSFEGAGRIHTDFQKGFIAAEIISYSDFIEYKGEQGAKLAGKQRIERSANHLLQDGDIVCFRFNYDTRK